MLVGVGVITSLASITALIMALKRTQHHPMLAEADRLLVPVGRDMLDGQRGHLQSPINVTDSYSCNFAPVDKTLSITTGRSAIQRIPWMMCPPLLAPDEPQPVTVTNEDGGSPFVIVADHAGKYLPRRLQNLGLAQAECERHIAWDIGAGAVARMVGAALDAVVIGRTIPASSSTAIACRAPRRRSSN